LRAEFSNLALEKFHEGGKKGLCSKRSGKRERGHWQEEGEFVQQKMKACVAREPVIGTFSRRSCSSKGGKKKENLAVGNGGGEPRRFTVPTSNPNGKGATEQGLPRVDKRGVTKQEGEYLRKGKKEQESRACISAYREIYYLQLVRIREKASVLKKVKKKGASPSKETGVHFEEGKTKTKVFYVKEGSRKHTFLGGKREKILHQSKLRGGVEPAILGGKLRNCIFPARFYSATKKFWEGTLSG